MIIKGQLATELLRATNSAADRRKARKEASNKVVQKYGEIYGSVARRQIAEDEKDERQVVNMREKRLQDPWKRKYKAMIAKFPKIYCQIRAEGHFHSCAT
jgi:ribosomal protein L9